MLKVAMAFTVAACLLVPGRADAGTRAALSAWQSDAGTTKPAINAGHLIYDEARRRLIMVEAYQPPAPPERVQVWAWERSDWRQVPVDSAPPMRTLSGAAYDTRRRRLVLHGGLGNTGLDDPRGDTWEWDGRRWIEMRGTGVGPRDHHTLAYDEGRGRVVLFGGVATTRRGDAQVRESPTDTWEWDGARWTAIDAPGPAARGGAGMVYDRARRHVVLFGGVSFGSGPATRFADTWIWDGRAWRRVAGDGPAPPGRNGHAMVFDRDTGTVLMWGGTTGGSGHLGDLWRWDGSRWTEVAVPEPRPGRRVGASMAYDAARGRIVLYGGRARDNGQVRTLDDMWEWDGARWTRVR
jgi:hypothetical protein